MKPDLSPQDLMKALGSKGGYFDPIPPDQHAWPMMLATNPGINVFRLWSWMCAHTIRKGRRKGYVCDERGRPLSVEDAAVDLKMDPGVCRRAWRDGVALGLWRKGTHASDKRQLFLNAKVVPVAPGLEEEQGEQDEQDDQEENSDTKKGEENAKIVCTDLFPPYLRLQIKRLPKAKRKIFETEYERNERLYKDVHADVTVAVRLIFDQREDTIFDKFGIKKIREEHTPKNGAAKSPARVQLVQEFLPGLEKFVQTFEERSVQAQGESVQTQKDPVVQTVGKRAENGTTPAVSKTSTNGDKRAVLEGERTSLAPATSLLYSQRSHPRPPHFSPTPSAQSKAEEEEQPSYQKFKDQYPAGHFDEPKTKPFFEAKTKAQQGDILDRLRVYLASERWKDDGGRWIPLASTWLKSYDADPPPALKKAAAASAKKGFAESVMEEAKRRFDKYGRV